jgi:hypothetical protein
MLLGDWEGLLSLGPFGHKVCKELGFDCRLGYVCHVEPYELECPCGDTSCGESVSDNFPDLKRGHQPDWVALKVMQ